MGRYTTHTAPAWARMFIEQLHKVLGISVKQLFQMAVLPPQKDMGDLAVPLFLAAKEQKQSPALLAQTLSAQIPNTKAQGPYLNYFACRSQVLVDTISQVQTQGSKFAQTPVSPRRVAVIDYSSPNIAKPLAFHHIRSTMIGSALHRILTADGYTVHAINYLGDWGTQFGYIIQALSHKSKEDIESMSLNALVQVYVDERKKAEQNPQIHEYARQAFARLEQKDARARDIWQIAKKITLRQFKDVYARLGVSFTEENYIGESFFEPDLVPVIQELQDKHIATTSEGALIVDLKEENIDAPCLIRKADGATLYATREIASARYRYYHYTKSISDWNPSQDEWVALYVVDQGQALHFKQLKAVLKKMKEPFYEHLIHVPFGVLLLWSEEEQSWMKGKTRSGNAILLEDVLNEAQKRVLSIIDEKNPLLPHKAEIADKIGVGAIIFNDLKNKRTNDVKFKFEDALALEGETGPYVHNALVRTKSIIKKAQTVIAMESTPDLSVLVHPRELEIAMILADYQSIIHEAASTFDPSLIARYLLQLAGAFHAFHHDCLVIDTQAQVLSRARLALTEAVLTVLESAMYLIGLQSIEAM